MLSRTLRASPLGGLKLVARPPAVRAVSTDAASASVVSGTLPDGHDTPFKVQLSRQVFEGYNLDIPSLEMQTTRSELRQMYHNMISIRYVDFAWWWRKKRLGDCSGGIVTIGLRDSLAGVGLRC